MREQTLVGIGVYKKEDYEEIRRISVDRDDMDISWKDWKNKKRKAEKNFKSSGFNLVDIEIRPYDLVKYAREHGLPINGKTRSEYITFQTSKINKSQ